MFVIPDDIQFNRSLSITIKSFIRALAHHCGDKNVCWPSQQRIAEFMNCSTRTVRRMERQAIELRLIEVRRRWLKSNVYTVLCLEERKNSTMGTECCPVEQNTQVQNNVETGSKESPKQRGVSPREIHLLLGDIQEVMGPHIMQRNRGWFIRIIRHTTYDLLQQCLSVVRQSILEAQCGSGEVVQNPSGFLTWLVRRAGVLI